MPNLMDILQGALSQQQPQQGRLSQVLQGQMPGALAASNPMGNPVDLRQRRQQLMSELPQYNPEVKWALDTSRVFMQSRGQKQQWDALQQKLNGKEQELEAINAALGIK